MQLVQLNANNRLTASLTSVPHRHLHVRELPRKDGILAPKTALDLVDRYTGQLDLTHLIRAQPFSRSQHGRRDVCTRVFPIHQGFADGIDSYRIGSAADRIEVSDQVIPKCTERAVPLTGI